MNFVELKNNLLKNVSNFYILEGNDDFLISHSQKLICDARLKSFELLNYVKIDASNISQNALESTMATLPFGESDRVVVIENFIFDDDFLKIIDKYKICDNSGIVIILVMPTIKANYKDSQYVNCNKLDSRMLNKWVSTFISNKKIEITTEASEVLINIADSNLSVISKELEKICAFVGNGGKITKDIIIKNIQKTENYFLYNLTAAFEQSDKQKIQYIINSMTENSNIQLLFSGLGNYFRRMCYAKISSQNDNDLAKVLKIKPYAVKKSREVVYKNKIDFEAKYREFVELDYKIKNGLISPNSAIYKLLLM